MPALHSPRGKWRRARRCLRPSVEMALVVVADDLVVAEMLIAARQRVDLRDELCQPNSVDAALALWRCRGKAIVHRLFHRFRERFAVLLGEIANLSIHAFGSDQHGHADTHASTIGTEAPTIMIQKCPIRCSR